MINSLLSNTKVKSVLAQGTLAYTPFREGCKMEDFISVETRHCKLCGQQMKWEENSGIANRQEKAERPQGEKETRQVRSPQSLG